MIQIPQITDEFTEIEETGRKKRRIKWIITLVCVAVAVLLLLLMFLTYGFIAGGKFSLGTTINGVNCSGKTVEEAVSAIEKKLLGKKVEIEQDGETLFTGDLASLGVSLDGDRISAKVNEVFESQQSNDFRLLQTVATVQMADIYQVDEDVLRDLLNQYLTINTTQTSNACVEYNGDEFVIVPEQYGDEFDLDAFLVTIEKGIARSISGEVGNLVISVTADDFPSPTIFSDNEALQEQRDVYNKMTSAQITYTFGGDVTETITQEQIIGFYKQTEDGIELDTDAVQIYVHNLAQTYDTYRSSREFTTHDGDTVTLYIVTYGYQISETGEYEQLLEDLETGGVVEREPVYYKTGYQRAGMDDLCGTYVEVDISEQHVWYYKDYELIIESDCVSGNLAKGYDSSYGMFYVAYKRTDYTLKGDGYSSFVNYWMPYYGGQGLHDADGWRSYYGGAIYKTNGSHGCINLPKSAARTIYENIEAGVPVIVHE